MLDVQHNCALVWDLGGYTSPEPGGTEPEARPTRLSPRGPTTMRPRMPRSRPARKRRR